MKNKRKKLNVRQKAARRAVAGGFNKALFKKIGGKECPRYAALTWKERDKVHDEIPSESTVRTLYGEDKSNLIPVRNRTALGGLEASGLLLGGQVLSACMQARSE